MSDDDAFDELMDRLRAGDQDAAWSAGATSNTESPGTFVLALAASRQVSGI